MTITIEIPPETEQRLRNEASRHGVDEVQYARRLIEPGLPSVPTTVDQATIDLFAKWDKEDETSDPEELARRNREFDELKTALNQNRIDAGGPNARKVFP